MYSTTKLNITLDRILELTTEYDLYQYYSNYTIKIGRIMHSPLRKDKTPSFGIFKGSSGKLLFKDHGTGDCGDVITFISKLHNISYTQALRMVFNDVTKQHILITDTGKYVQEQYDNIRKSISVQRRNFTETDDKYWSKFHINRTTLKEFNVYPIQYFWVDDVIKPISYTTQSPMYAYQIYLSFKIYRPLAPKTYKWYSNCSLYDLQGLEQLPDKGDLLIITKSLKDVMVLYELGYTAIAPHGEGYSIPNKIIDTITDRFNNIILFYDNDNAGRQATDKLVCKYNYPHIFTPVDSGVKDISDYIAKYGIEQTKTFLNKQLI